MSLLSEYPSLKFFQHADPAVAEQIASPAFIAAIRLSEASDAIKALLSIEMLKGVALDPLASLRGSPPILRMSDGSVAVNLSFHRFHNFIGAFSLPADSPVLPRLQDAVGANLADPMHKAARVSRRLSGVFSRLDARNRDKADALYAMVHNHVLDSMPLAGLSPSALLQVQEKAKEGARVARQAAFAPRDRQLVARWQFIEQMACPGFPGHYTAAVAKFLCTHLEACAQTALRAASLPDAAAMLSRAAELTHPRLGQAPQFAPKVASLRPKP